MNRVAVFVDAGYLFAQGSQELFGKKLDRVYLKLNPHTVANSLKDFAESTTGLELLRIYWYDGTSGKPTPQHIELAELPNVKVRLGIINTFNKQKGVDSLIVTDMVTLAQNGAVASCILLGGDEDLRVGVQLAQEQGVRIHLLGIKPAKKSQSDLLRQEADVVYEWEFSDIEPFLSRYHPSFAKKLSSSISSITEVGKAVADLVPKDEITGVLSSSLIPKDYHGQLMRWGRDLAKKKMLDNDQKKELEHAFINHLKSRGTG